MVRTYQFPSNGLPLAISQGGLISPNTKTFDVTFAISFAKKDSHFPTFIDIHNNNASAIYSVSTITENQVSVVCSIVPDSMRWICIGD